jgi:hypothetical protein
LQFDQPIAERLNAKSLNERFSKADVGFEPTNNGSAIRSSSHVSLGNTKNNENEQKSLSMRLSQNLLHEAEFLALADVWPALPSDVQKMIVEIAKAVSSGKQRIVAISL